MSWITLTPDDILLRLAGAEKAAYTTAALAGGQSDPLPEILEQVTDEVRGYIAACASNTLGPAGTLPPRLRLAALDIARYRLVTRLPNRLTDERKEEYRNAIKLLESVASCKFAVEDPAGDATSGAQVNSPATRARDRYFSRSQQEGI
jgi:phage gp36-like protein